MVKVMFKSDDQDEVVAYGKVIPANKWTDIDDKFAAKAAGNPTLQVQGAKKQEAEPATSLSEVEAAERAQEHVAQTSAQEPEPETEKKARRGRIGKDD